MAFQMAELSDDEIQANESFFIVSDTAIISKTMIDGCKVTTKLKESTAYQISEELIFEIPNKYEFNADAGTSCPGFSVISSSGNRMKCSTDDGLEYKFSIPDNMKNHYAQYKAAFEKGAKVIADNGDVEIELSLDQDIDMAPGLKIDIMPGVPFYPVGHPDFVLTCSQCMKAILC